MFQFKVIHQSTKSLARVCEIHTPHGNVIKGLFLMFFFLQKGIIETPGFVPVCHFLCYIIDNCCRLPLMVL